MGSLGMKLHLRPVGKPAPPLPRMPDFLTSSTIHARPLATIEATSDQSPRFLAAGRPGWPTPLRLLNTTSRWSSIGSPCGLYRSYMRGGGCWQTPPRPPHHILAIRDQV